MALQYQKGQKPPSRQLKNWILDKVGKKDTPFAIVFHPSMIPTIYFSSLFLSQF
jgi:hypothetical protein